MARPLLSAALAVLFCQSMCVPAVAQTIPQSCAACRFVETEQRFMACLEACLGARDATVAPLTRDGALREAQWAGWRFNRERTFASKTSTNTVVDSMERTSAAELTLSPHHGKKGVRLKLGRMSFSIISPKVTFVVDGKRFTLEGDRYSSSESFWTTDEALLSALRKGKQLTATVTPFAETTHSFTFDLSGVKNVTDVIWP